MSHVRFVLLALTLLLLGGCDRTGLDTAMGESDVITIVADSADYDAVSEVFENAFTRPVFTPQPESWFQLTRIGVADLLNRKNLRNLLIMAPIDAQNAAGELMRAALSAEVQALVREGREHIFVKRDLWYRDQTVVFVTGADVDALRDAVLQAAPELHHYFKSAWDEREKRRLLSLGREEELEERYKKDYGWSIGIIKGWFVGKDSSELKSVLLRRQHPAGTERWVLVHWIDSADTRLLTSTFALETRNRLTQSLYRTFDDSTYVRVDEINHLQFDQVDFNGRFAIRMQGLWQMADYSMGGPFVSYLFYEESQKRLYFIDGSVFAPAYEKRKLVQDVDVMLHTLTFAPPATPS
jgi:hypothetical protein